MSFSGLNKPRKDFIVCVLWHILSIKGKINFLQLGRFSSRGEQSFRNQFNKKFDFAAFNKQLINDVSSGERIVALDPSYIPKAGKFTFGRGKYWSGVAKAAKWGLDICGFAVVDVTLNTALHLNAWQTPSADDLVKKGLNLLTYYASLVTDNATKFKEYSDYIVADAYFSKLPFVKSVMSASLHLISRLRDDSVLMYKYRGKPTGKKGRPKKFAGRVDVKNLDPDCFCLDMETKDIQVYSSVVYSKAFKREIKLAVAIFFKDGKEIARQARGEKKLDFHFNAALTATNLAKHDWLSNKDNCSKPFSMANYKTLYNNTLMLERFMCRFAINPNTAKNQKIVKELLEYGKIAA